MAASCSSHQPTMNRHSTATNTALTPITVAQVPSAVVITPNGKTAYVASSFGTVTPVNTATNQTGQPIPIPIPGGGTLSAMAITPDGKVLLVSGGGVSGHAEVTPVNTVTNKAGQPIPVRLGPIDIAITPDGKTAYVVNFGTGRVAGRTVTPIRIATLRAGPAIRVGLDPVDLVISR